ncbi:MAG TPA: hypothetical protein VN776_03270 [Terracidiphilus sp.]|nr:hypothetical protein [Terracidiphilus sp.]
MNRYILIRRLRGPAFLLLVGVNALLAQAHILGWGRSWPFYLILAGVIALAERAALAADGGMTPPPYPGAPYAGAPSAAPQSPAPESASIVPAHSHDFGNDSDGGQS